MNRFVDVSCCEIVLFANACRKTRELMKFDDVAKLRIYNSNGPILFVILVAISDFVLINSGSKFPQSLPLRLIGCKYTQMRAVRGSRIQSGPLDTQKFLFFYYRQFRRSSWSNWVDFQCQLRLSFIRYNPVIVVKISTTSGIITLLYSEQKYVKISTESYMKMM